MSSGQTIRLISAIAELLGVLVWPAVVLFFIVWFRSGLADFLSNLAEFSFKVRRRDRAAGNQREQRWRHVRPATARRDR